MSVPAERRAGAPALVCLNLQYGHVDPDDDSFAPGATNALVHIHACLAWARGQAFRLVHVHTPKADRSTKPIPGCEPRITEELVYKRSTSFVSSGEVARLYRPIDQAFVLGFTGVRDCIAAAVDAERTGAKLIFISDAIASPALPGLSETATDDVVSALLAEWAPLITTRELLARDKRLPMTSRGA